MAYSETDKTYIRRYVGYGAIFLQAEPRLENAIQATQWAIGSNTTDAALRTAVTGNTRPMDSTRRLWIWCGTWI